MKVVRTSEMPWNDSLNQGAYRQQRKPLVGVGVAAGVWRLPAGTKSFPLHAHHITEEALYVLSGSAKVRTPEGITPIGPGDWVSFEPGGPAHQLISDDLEDCVYLAISVPKGVDVVEYSDSGKLACSVGTFPNGQRFMFRKDAQVGYFEGEPDAFNR
jgi:uncharacterized cupin superfamily protein